MKYIVVEVYKRGEKVYKGKAHRLGWKVYRRTKDGDYVSYKLLPEGKGGL